MDILLEAGADVHHATTEVWSLEANQYIHYSILDIVAWLLRVQQV